MPFEEIVLDDRRFEDLVAEAKRRIPGYTPEWTDLNDSDPGIALTQLFAWLGEMILYRLNRVPDKNYLKFLQLIGIQLAPPVPAEADLAFTLTSKDLGRVVEVPQGTRVALADAVDGQPVIFETDDSLYAVGGELQQLQSFDGARYKLLTEEKRVETGFFHPLSETPQAGAAFLLGFDRAFPAGRHRLRFYAYTADLIAEGKGVAADAPVPAPPVEAVWEYWAGKSAGWQRLTVVSDDTASLTRTGFLEFEAPSGHQAVKYGLLQGDQDDALFWLRYRVVELLGAGYELAPRLEDVALNTVTATNAVTVTDELLGASDGLPDQEFELAQAPVLPGTLVLEVDEGDGWQPWQAAGDFAASGREDRHYTLDAATGTVRFGDGKQGKIPRALLPEGPDGRPSALVGSPEGRGLPNVRARRYRWGGGERGNAGAGKITSLESSVPFVDSVTNPRPASGGQDEESLAHARQRAPEAIRSRERAVTAADFEFLARQTPGARIRRAKALPLHHPDYQPARPAAVGRPAVTVPVPGVVTVLVVPDSKSARPMPTEDTLGRVAAWLRSHALLTTEIYVAAPRYRKVSVEARVVAQSTAASGQVDQALTRMLLDYFHPLRGGEARQGETPTGWPFGGTISFAEVYRRILDTDGVKSLAADALTLLVDGERIDQCVDVELGPDELVYSESHDIRVSYS